MTLWMLNRYDKINTHDLLVVVNKTATKENGSKNQKQQEQT
jgi:hypothetical protein